MVIPFFVVGTDIKITKITTNFKNFRIPEKFSNFPYATVWLGNETGVEIGIETGIEAEV